MKIDLSHIISIIFGLSGWVFHLLNSKINKKYKSIEYLDKELRAIDISKKDLKLVFNSLENQIKSGKYNIPKIKPLYQKALDLYYNFFNSLDHMCGIVQYGVVDADYFEKQVGENMCTLAEAQVHYVSILKILSDKLMIPFGLGKNKDTYRNFYKFVASKKTKEECYELSQKRKKVGLPNYNVMTDQIDFSNLL